MINIKDKRKPRERMSDDFICGYLSAISDILSDISILKGSFDLETFRVRASQKVDKRIKRKSNKQMNSDPK